MNFQFARSEIASAFPPEILHFIGRAKQWSTPSPAEGHLARTDLAAFLADTSWSAYFDQSRNSAAQIKARLRKIAGILGLSARHKAPPVRLAQSGLDLTRISHMALLIDAIDR